MKTSVLACILALFCLSSYTSNGEVENLRIIIGDGFFPSENILVTMEYHERVDTVFSGILIRESVNGVNIFKYSQKVEDGFGALKLSLLERKVSNTVYVKFNGFHEISYSVNTRNTVSISVSDTIGLYD